MLPNCIPTNLLGTDAALVSACRTFCQRFADFVKSGAAFDLAESRSGTDPRTVELQASTDALLAEWRLIASKVGTMPARRAVGLRAKAGVLGVLLAQSGASGIEADLTRSLIADLNQVGEVGLRGYLTVCSKLHARRYGTGNGAALIGRSRL